MSTTVASMIFLYFSNVMIDELHKNNLMTERGYSFGRMLWPRQLIWYIYCISIHDEINTSPEIRFEKIFWGVIFVILVIIFFLLLSPLCKEVLHPPCSKDKFINVFNVIHWLSSLLFIATSINYLVYIIEPAHFSIPDDMTVLETAFEFLYYTFTLMITYSGTDVSAITIFSKTLQMIEISIFYFVIANLISSFAERLTESNDADSNDTTDHEQSNKANSKKPDEKNRKKSKKYSSRKQ